MTSWIHCSSASLFFPPRPHLRTHSCLSSSHTSRSRVLWLMPFSLANRSHLVSGLGFGRGFSRGRSVVGAGGRKTGPSGVECVWSANSDDSRLEADASVSCRRCCSRLAEYRAGSVGVWSCAVSRPRSIWGGSGRASRDEVLRVRL